MNNYLFTSESVSEGHPDKIADQISDAILDAVLEQDERARVAVETLTKTGMVLVAGELTTTANVDLEAITRETVKEIGYTGSAVVRQLPAEFDPEVATVTHLPYGGNPNSLLGRAQGDWSAVVVREEV